MSRALAAILFTTLSAAACSVIPRDSFTAQEQKIAQVPGFPGVRFWVDGSAAELKGFFRSSDINRAIAETGRFDVLAISGGAYDGAFGAGIMNGWTASGTRPKFTVVSGVSAGALIAPAAFLGPDYDAVIAKAFTSGIAQVLGDGGSVLALLGTPDMRRGTLVELIEEFVDRRLLRAVAAECARGRKLYVVTTNLDAQRGVVWDMGAIAASNNPEALQLFRDVLTASASIPGLFAPTQIEVEANGRRFREIHVDGGAATQVFIIPDALLASGGSAKRIERPIGTKMSIYVIINNQLTPQFEVVEGGVLPIISRSFSTLIKNDTKATLLATSAYVGRENFNLSYIDDGARIFIRDHAGPDVKPGFNTAYMRAIYDYGFRRAKAGAQWVKEVPLPGDVDKRVRAAAMPR